MKTLLATISILALLVLPTPAEAAKHCDVVDHRAGATSTVDDNTLEGLLRDAQHGYVSEVDGRVLVDGYTVYHENRWEQYTTGVGTPETSTAAYTDTLETLDNNQQVPLMSQVIAQTNSSGGRVLMELDEPDSWTVEAITGLVQKLKKRHVWEQWIFTGTKGVLLRLMSVAPKAVVSYRLDSDETLTFEQAEKYGIDMLAVGDGFTKDQVQLWRRHGYKVWGRQTDSESFDLMYSHGIRTLQTGVPGAWLSFCEEQ